MRSTTALDPALEKLIRADLGRARNLEGLGCWSVFLGIFTLASVGLGVYLVLGALRYNHADDAEQYAMMFGASAVVSGLATLAVLRRRSRVRSALHDAVVTRRADVVWVYPKHTSVDLRAYYGGHHVGHEQRLGLVVAFADGTSVEIGLESMIEQVEAAAALTRWLPHAQHGYSAELAQAYAASPASLRRT